MASANGHRETVIFLLEAGAVSGPTTVQQKALCALVAATAAYTADLSAALQQLV